MRYRREGRMGREREGKKKGGGRGGNRSGKEEEQRAGA